MPDDDLVQRLRHWATNLPGMSDAVMRLVAGGYLDDAVFVRECVVDLDGSDVAVVDWVAARELLTTHYAGDEVECLRDALRAADVSKDEGRRWALDESALR